MDRSYGFVQFRDTHRSDKRGKRGFLRNEYKYFSRELEESARGFIILNIIDKRKKKKKGKTETIPKQRKKVHDKEAQKHWKDYSEARNKMLLKTNFKHAPG